ncbi:MAG: class I SAM-dependent methyltransferase [Verrucomicrobiota bacterium]
MFRKQCLSCKSEKLQEIINLGMHPMADTYIPVNRMDEADRVYPLICDLCESCGQIQLRTVTSPAERYSDVEYSYTSSNSKTAQTHWINYAADVAEMIGLKRDDAVLEIGSNDGFLTEQFRILGCKCLGIDPSPTMVKLALERGIKTIEGLFSENSADEVEKILGKKPKLIAANNVFNHANEPFDFAQGIKSLLAPDGTFVFQVPYWLQLFVQEKIDQVYHEHVSHFTVRHAVNLFKSVGMTINHVEENDYHGGSIRVFVGHKPMKLVAKPGGLSVEQFIEKENDLGLFNLDIYKKFREQIQNARNRFLQEIYRLKNEGKAIVCVGAAAKGNTFLNYYNLDASVIDYVTDSSPCKIGKYTPRTRIPIASDDILRNYPSVHAIILSWNISAALQTILKKINPHIIFLNPYKP